MHRGGTQGTQVVSPAPAPMNQSPILGATLRFDLPCEALGFTSPAMPINLKFLGPSALGPLSPWTAILYVAAGQAAQAVAWMRSQAAGDATIAPGLAPRTVRYAMPALPPAWERWLTAARILQVDLASHGLATVYVQGSTAELATLAGRLTSNPSAMRQRVSGTKPLESVAITPRQLEALCNAVTMGYYDVPHRVDLRHLGRSMDLSVSAVSQLLRRAQGEVIRAFVDTSALNGSKERAQNGQDGQDGPPPKGV